MMTTQQEFIKHIASLAGEGETALVLRQKPYLVDGAPQFYANGGIKATWPAYLPSHKINPAWSVFMNTAAFIVDRFKGGHPSASAANCEFVLVMMLDDIGTPKAKTPPIEPSWILETSEGCFQWGYIFSEQPRKGEYCAAWAAIAAAGYTDPGAGNAVRNFRIPGSVNLKPERKGFVSRLVEWHPEREFTLEQLCAAFNVVPGEVQSVHKPLRLTDDGNDDVLKFLNDSGLVASAPNHEGWLSVICPNAEKHSDGSPVGRYLPSNRSFCCFHSSCVEINSTEFLRWVAEQGGPDHQPGARDDLVAKKVGEALAKLTPTAAYPDEAAKVIEEVDRRELGRIQKADWFKEFAYVLPDDGYFSMTTRQELTRRGFDAVYRHIGCKSIHGKNPRVSASYSFDESRQEKGARVLDGIAYAPGESVLVLRNNQAFGNRWRDARPVGIPGDISPWLDHCEALVPDLEQREHIFNVMAFKMQNPAVKINHAILMGGAPGCGKDTLWAPFIWSVCGPGLHNYALVDAERIESQWGYQYESEIFVLNELREPEARERRALANKLKPIIAAPPDVISVNRKGLAPYDASNRLLVIAFTNDYAPISIESDDRRWFCVWTHAPKMEDGRKIWNWYKSGGYEACAAWLRARDVSAFNPAAPAPMTDFKQSMIESSLSPAEAAIMRLIEAGVSDFGKGVVASPWQSVADRLMAHMPESGRRVHPNAVVHALKQAGWVDCGRIMSREHTNKKHLFVRPDMMAKPKSELRALVEAPPPPIMQLVK